MSNSGEMSTDFDPADWAITDFKRTGFGATFSYEGQTYSLVSNYGYSIANHLNKYFPKSKAYFLKKFNKFVQYE